MQFEVMLASCIIISDKLRYDLTNRENEKLYQIFALRCRDTGGGGAGGAPKIWDFS